MATYRSSTKEDCFILAPLMREQDKVEVMFSHGVEPLEALLACLESHECNTIVHQGQPVGMFGIHPVDDLTASPWMLGTDKIPEIARDVMKVSSQWVKDKNKEYPILVNYVHEDNEVSKVWLRKLGFTFIQLIDDYGVGKQPFYEFTRIN